jgi:nuclease HARBI1
MAQFMNVVERQKKHYKIRATQAETDYRKLYRFTHENVIWIAKEILGESYETRGGALSHVQKVEITLRYLANPGFQIGIAKEVGVHATTVCKIIPIILEKLCEYGKDIISFPQQREQIEDAKQRWAAVRGFPSTIGAIDCTHVRIDKPKVHGDEYINRKGYPSLNVQATVNEKYMFTSIDVGWPGSVHDNRIFKNSLIYQQLLRSPHNPILLGDEGYSLTPFLMTPFGNPVNDEERRYNIIHSRNRVIIEHTFGQLKRRFPILRYGVRIKLERVPICIAACFVLHNIAKSLNDPDFEDDEDVEENVFENDLLEPLSENELRVQGHLRRHQIASSFII